MPLHIIFLSILPEMIEANSMADMTIRGISSKPTCQQMHFGIGLIRFALMTDYLLDMIALDRKGIHLYLVASSIPSGIAQNGLL